MHTSAQFDNKIALWKQEMELPWSKLKYKLVQSNLAKYLGQNQMRVLDAGGGNGLDSVPFAGQGHFVDLVDYSQEMLADARQRAAQVNAQARVATHLADVRDVSKLFPDLQFDLILCHNVLQYIDDVPTLMRAFSGLLKPDGIISVVSINRYSAPYHAAFLDGNFAEAGNLLNSHTSRTKIFDTNIVSYSADEISEIMNSFGMITEKDYGIRCLCDYWGDNERKSDPGVFEQIERLEFALTELHPYKLLARFFQIIARKV
ncbi:MAG: class I SAM-dependent methyltransferase [Chloroflexi bacterium]|nr:MAG: class I SAM-dependent methyltransferase [Chloroflexota bacterium]